MAYSESGKAWTPFSVDSRSLILLLLRTRITALYTMWSLLVFAGMVAAGPQSLVGTAVNVSISDMSPMLAYAPSASGPADIAWNQTYSNTSWSVYTPQYPVSFDGGDSAHTTSFSGASVAHEFIGTAVYFYGSASGTLTLNIDGTEQKVDVEMPSHGLLASSTGLANGRHSAVLALSGGTLSVQNVTVELQVGGDGYESTRSH